MSMWITEAVTLLDEVMASNYEQYVMTIIDGWGDCIAAANPGQVAIISRYITPVALEHVREAAYWWPYGVGPDEYVESVYACFDSGVIRDCFSETISRQYDECLALKTEAEEWQHEHEALVAIIGDSFEPHSVATDWMGTRTS